MGSFGEVTQGASVHPSWGRFQVITMLLFRDVQQMETFYMQNFGWLFGRELVILHEMLAITNINYLSLFLIWLWHSWWR